MKVRRSRSASTPVKSVSATSALVKCALLTSVGLSAIISSAAVQAQDNDGADSNIIIVTASKRETTLQEVPIAVSVTSGEDIEDAQVRDLLDLQTLVPSLRVSQLQSSANTNFIIRGFGNGANNPGIEPSVGVFIDGVYRSRSAAQIGDLPDVQRVEVLRGPQSTLFGKNASAGIISVVTAKPQFDFGGQVEANYGNFDAILLRGSITGPITDSIAFSLGGNFNQRDGFAQDLNLGTDINDRNRYGVRGQLLFEPSSDFSIRLIGDFDKIDENCCVAANVLQNPGITGALSFAQGGGPAIEAEDPFSFNVRNNFASTNEIENYGGSAQIDYSTGPFSFTSITAYREVRSDTNQDSDFTSADLIGRNAADTAINTFTQELRVATDFDGPLNFLLGGYYFDEKIDFGNELFFGGDFRNYASALIGAGTGGTLNASLLEGALGVPQQTFFQQGQGVRERFDYSNDSFSIFGQADFEPLDGLTFTVGFNYTEDRKRVTSAVTSTDAFSALDLVAVGFAQGLGAQGVNPRNPAAVQAFAVANPAIFSAIQAGAQNSATNPLLALSGLQFLPQFLNFPNAVEDGRTNDSDLAYTLRANYEVTPNVNVYGTYATGFKASSFNLSRDSRPFPADFIPGSSVTNPAASPIRNAGLALPNLTTGTRFAAPENAEVFEVGIKGQWALASFNFAAFQQSIKGFQSNIFTGTGFALDNAGEQSTFGIEFDGTVTPTDGLKLFVAMTYLDAVYDDFTNSAVGDLTGLRPAGIPEISASFGGSYLYEFDGGTTLQIRGDYAYESDTQIVDGLPGFAVTTNGVRNNQPARDIARAFRREVNNVSASATLGLTNGLEVSVWGRNLLDNQFLGSVFDSVAQAGSVSGYPNQPRTYGGTLRFKF